jgi:hypothetical protein
LEGVPLVQMSLVQVLPSTGTSALSFTVTVEPAPLHWFFLQSPGDCEATGVPAAVNDKPHAFALHVRVWHSVSVPAHVAATTHCTQAPAPLHTAPPFWLQAAPDAVGGFDGMPAVHTSPVH